MKSIKIFVAALLIVTTSFSLQAQGTIDEARVFYDGALEKFNNKDYPAYLETISDNFEGYTGVHSPFRYDDKGAWSIFIMGLESFTKVHYDQKSATYRAFGNNTIVINAYFTFTVESRNNSVDVQNGRETTVLIKEGADWKIVNLHFSGLF